MVPPKQNVWNSRGFIEIRPSGGHSSQITLCQFVVSPSVKSLLDFQCLWGEKKKKNMPHTRLTEPHHILAKAVNNRCSKLDSCF